MLLHVVWKTVETEMCVCDDVIDVQTMIDEAIHAAKREQLVALSSECQLSLEELDGTVEPIIHSCTKEAISVCSFYTLFLRRLGIEKLQHFHCLMIEPSHFIVIAQPKHVQYCC